MNTWSSETFRGEVEGMGSGPQGRGVAERDLGGQGRWRRRFCSTPPSAQLHAARRNWGPDPTWNFKCATSHILKGGEEEAR